MVVSPRQPGSALKPFLYALAFDRGYTPATILPDIARVYQTSHRALCTAQLRPPLPRSGARAGGTRQLVQRSRGRAGGAARRRPACCRCSAVPGSPRWAGARSSTGSASRSATATSPCSSSPTDTVRSPTAVCGDPYHWRSRTPGEAVEPAYASPSSARRRWCSTSWPIRWREFPAFGLAIAARLPLSRRGQDRYQPALHRQLGGGDDGPVHGRGLGRELQRPSDGRRERRERRRSAAAPGGARDRAATRPRRAADPGGHRRGSGHHLPALRARRDRALSPGRSSGSLRATRRVPPAAGITMAAWSSRGVRRMVGAEGSAGSSGFRHRSQSGRLAPAWSPTSSSSRRSTETCTECRPARSRDSRRSPCAPRGGSAAKGCAGTWTGRGTAGHAGDWSEASIASARCRPRENRRRRR